jgi:hypothetical protein
LAAFARSTAVSVEKSRSIARIDENLTMAARRSLMLDLVLAETPAAK